MCNDCIGGFISDPESIFIKMPNCLVITCEGANRNEVDSCVQNVECIL